MLSDSYLEGHYGMRLVRKIMGVLYSGGCCLSGVPAGTVGRVVFRCDVSLLYEFSRVKGLEVYCCVRGNVKGYNEVLFEVVSFSDSERSLDVLRSIMRYKMKRNEWNGYELSSRKLISLERKRVRGEDSNFLDVKEV